MGWTAPTTRSTGDLITAAIWNTDLVNNLTYLKGVGSRILGTGSADAGTLNTTPTPFGSAGAAACAIALTLPVDASIAPVEIGLSYHYTDSGASSSPAGYIDFLDDVSGAAIDSLKFAHAKASTANIMQRGQIVFTTESLTAGTHTITPRLYSANGGWGFYVADNAAGLHYVFWVRQVPS